MLGLKRRSNKTSAEEQQKHIHEWEQSGLTQAQYCRKNDISQNQLSYWRQRQDSKAETFFEVTANHSNSSTGIELSINDHLKIHLNKDFDQASLKRIITLVGEM